MLCVEYFENVRSLTRRADSCTGRAAVSATTARRNYVSGLRVRGSARGRRTTTERPNKGAFQACNAATDGAGVTRRTHLVNNAARTTCRAGGGANTRHRVARLRVSRRTWQRHAARERTNERTFEA